MSGRLDGRVALVTGGARRLGRAICRSLAREGARVLVHYRWSRTEAETLCAEIVSSGGTAEALAADLAVPARAAELVREAARRGGRLDLLVNNASLYRPTPLADLDEADWDAHLDVDLKAPFLACLEAARTLADGGAIVNLTDAGWQRPAPDLVAYKIAKAGLTAATRQLAVALAPRIRVNAVAPGPILLPAGAVPGDVAGHLDRVAGHLDRVPLGRMGAPGDIAEAVVYLAGAGYVTGHVLAVDGGLAVG